MAGEGRVQICFNGLAVLGHLVQRGRQRGDFRPLLGGLLLEQPLLGPESQGLALRLARRGYQGGGALLGRFQLLAQAGQRLAQLGDSGLLFGNLPHNAAAAAVLILQLLPDPLDVAAGIVQTAAADGNLPLLLVQRVLLPGDLLPLLLQEQILLIQLQGQPVGPVIEGVELGVALLQLPGRGRVVGFGLLGRRRQPFEILEPDRNLQSFELGPKGQIFFRLLGLGPQGLHLQLQLRDLVVDAEQIVLGGRQTALGLLLAVAVFRDAGGLLEDLPAVGTLDGQNLVNAALTDIGIALLAQTGIHKHLVDIPEPGGLTINIVFTLAGAVIAPGHHDLGRIHRQRSIGIIKHQRGLGKPDLPALLRASEDHVLHLGAPQGFGAHLAHHPADGVGNIRFSAAVGADNGCDITVKSEDGLVRERLEALDFERFQIHAYTSPLF